MAAEEGLGGGEVFRADGGAARLARDDGIDKDERLPVRKAALDGIERTGLVH